MENNRTLEQQNNFRSIISQPDDAVYIWKKPHRRAFLVRDEWMVNHASKVIAVFNGTHGGTEYTINYAKKNNRMIDIIKDAENKQR